MSWLEKLLPPKIQQTDPSERRSVPEGLWIKCPACETVLYKTDLEQNLNVCPKCGHHHRIGARARLDTFLDAEGRYEIGQEILPIDALKIDLSFVRGATTDPDDASIVTAVIAVMGDAGRPNLTPVWFDYEGNTVLLNLATHRKKVGWLRKNGSRREEVSLDAFIAHIDHICQLAGNADHAGIGSDFDGGFGVQSVPAEIDTVADLQKLDPLLRGRGPDAPARRRRITAETRYRPPMLLVNQGGEGRAGCDKMAAFQSRQRRSKSPVSEGEVASRGGSMERYVGVDVGAETIKLAEVVREGDSLRLVRHALVPHGKEPGPRVIDLLRVWDWDSVSGAVATGRLGRQLALDRIPTKQALLRGFRFLYGGDPATVVHNREANP